MSLLRFSRRAETDLLEIGRYTLRTWGQAQTSAYLDELEKSCRLLAENPGLGRACDDIRPDLLRFESGRHVIFYKPQASGVLVVRILHERMLPTRQRLSADHHRK